MCHTSLMFGRGGEVGDRDEIMPLMIETNIMGHRKERVNEGVKMELQHEGNTSSS